MEQDPIKGESVAEGTARHLKDLILEGSLSPATCCCRSATWLCA